MFTIDLLTFFCFCILLGIFFYSPNHRLEETKTDIGHARSILRNQLFERLHMATDHKSAMEEMLSASLRSCETCLGKVLVSQEEEEEEEGEGVKEER